MKISKGLLLIVCFLTISCGASRKLATTTKVEQDTAQVQKVEIVEYTSVAPLNLEVGQSVHLPDLHLKVTRINKTEAVVESRTEVVRANTTEIQLVPTKTKSVNRSKDKSVNDSQIGNKVKTDIDTKEKKANNEKLKQNNKQVKRGSNWLIWVILAICIVVIVRFKLWKIINPLA